MSFSHTYDVLTCPVCNQDLTAERGIEMTVVIAGVPRDGIYTRLSNDGTLVDVDNLVANGYHGGTTCGKCDTALEEHEIFAQSVERRA